MQRSGTTIRHTQGSTSTFATAYAEEISVPKFRPYYISETSDSQLISAYIDNHVGEYRASENMTPADYQTTYTAEATNGYYPINLQTGVQIGVVGAIPRYAAIFASADMPTNRTFADNSPTNALPSAEIPAAKSALQSFMINNGVRSAQLTISKNGVEKYLGAYDYTDVIGDAPGRQPTTIGDRSLLAGLSEIFVAAYCFENILLQTTTTAYSTLGFSNPLDARSNAITVQQLLDHEGGYAWTSTGDPTTSTDPNYHMREVGAALNLNRAITAHDMAVYMYTRIRLDTNPGATYHDSSYGYVLLTLVLEAVTKTAFLVPYVYSGDGMIKEVAIGSAGLAGSASDLATFISTHACKVSDRELRGSRASAAMRAERRMRSREVMASIGLLR